MRKDEEALIIIKYARKKIVEELEMIKVEIQDLDLGFVDDEFKTGVAYGIVKFNQILNKHIFELKDTD